MNSYETLFIINTELEESEITKTIELIQDVITSGGGTILKLDKWGRRQLAYEIQKKREGYYVLLYFQASPEVLIELNRRYKLTDAIMRNLVVQLRKDQLEEIMNAAESAKYKAEEEISEASQSPKDEQEAEEETTTDEDVGNSTEGE